MDKSDKRRTRVSRKYALSMNLYRYLGHMR